MPHLVTQRLPDGTGIGVVAIGGHPLGTVAHGGDGLTEEVLRNRLAQLPNVRAMFGRTARQVEQDNQGAGPCPAGSC